MGEIDFEPLTINDVKTIYQRWYRLALFTFIGLIVPAVLVIFLILPLYEATASVLVNRQIHQADYSAESRNYSSTTTFRNLDRQEEIETHAEMIKARVIVEAMADRLDLTMEKLNRIRDARRFVQAAFDWVFDGFRYLYNETKYLTGLSPRPSPEEFAFVTRVGLIDEAAERISVDTQTESNVLRVSFRSSDPVLAKEAVNVIVEEFVNFYGNQKELREKKFFTEVAKKQGDELVLAEQELLTLKSQTSTYSLEQQQGLLLNQLSEAEERLRSIKITKALLNGKISAYNKRLAGEPEKILAREIMKNTPTGNVLEGKTLELNPVRQQLRMQLLQSEVELSALEQQASVAQALLEDYHLKLAEMNQMDIRIKQDTRKVKRLEKVYDLSVRNREQARSSEEMSLANLSTVRVVGLAPYPLKPIRPRKKMYLLYALGASLLVALAMPFLAYLNDSTITNERDVHNYLGIDFVATFPLTKDLGDS